MRDQSVLWSMTGNDECYSPSYAVIPILKYIPTGKIVWTPFDTPASQFVKLISKQNKVVSSHISEGGDFYNYEPKHWDVMVSNPPFRGKRQIFERALSFNTPFALLCTLTWLNDSAPKQVFASVDLQLLMFDKRIQFTSPDGTIGKRITFSTAYYCVGLLPKHIIMEKLAL